MTKLVHSYNDKCLLRSFHLITIKERGKENGRKKGEKNQQIYHQKYFSLKCLTCHKYDTTPQPCDESFKDEGLGKELEGLYYTQCHLLQGTDLQLTIFIP